MKNRTLKLSFKNAIHGIQQALRTERNLKVHFMIALLVLLLAVVLNVSFAEWLILIVIITLVIVTELINTAIEYMVDSIFGNNYNTIAKHAKDITAGATLVASISSIIIGMVIFLPKLLRLF